MWNFIGKEAIPKVCKGKRTHFLPRLKICNLGYLYTSVERQNQSAGVVLLMVCQSSIEVWTMLDWWLLFKHVL